MTPSTAKAAKRARTLALGAWLATRGPLAATGLILAALGAAASIAAAIAIARRGGHGASRLPMFASEAIAWSAGVMLAFGAALRATVRDREQGILALLRARGASVGDYVRGRVGGLVGLLAASVGGATLVATLAATSAGEARAVTDTLRAGLAALAYVVAFSATLGPVAMASLSARTRAGGYLTLVAVLFVPELLSPWTSSLLPRGWDELTSIPAALEAVRAAVTWPHPAAASGARALAGLGAVIAVSLLVVGMRVGPDAGQAS